MSPRPLPDTLAGLARQMAAAVDSLQAAGLQVLPPGGWGGTCGLPIATTSNCMGGWAKNVRSISLWQ